MDSSLGVIFVSLGIAKVDKQSIPKELGDIPIIALDNFGTNPLICTYHVPVLFWVELRGQFGGIDQVTKHQGQLSSFRVAKRRYRRERYNLRGWLFLSSRLSCCLSRLRDEGGCFRSVPSPHEHSAIFIRGELLCLDDLRLE